MSNTRLTKRLEAIERHGDVNRLPDLHRHIIESAEQIHHPERYELVSTQQVSERTPRTPAVFIHRYQRRP